MPRQIKEILIALGDEMRLELTKGGGEKTDTLISLISDENTDRSMTINALKKLASKSDDNLEFAKKIIELYDIK